MHDPLGALGGTRRAFVVPDLKILYISVAKNACTTIKWLVSELAGEDPRAVPPRRGSLRHQGRGHPRALPVGAHPHPQPDPGRRADGDLAGQRLVRLRRGARPAAGLFSAWQNKFLMRNPAYIQWRDEPWYPRVPQTARGRRRGLREVRRPPALPIRTPRCSTTRTSSRRSPTSPRTSCPTPRSTRSARWARCAPDLEEHVRAQGWTGDVRLGRSNDTPLRATADVFAAPVRERVDAYFREDLERFGDLWDLSRLESVPPWSSRRDDRPAGADRAERAHLRADRARQGGPRGRRDEAERADRRTSAAQARPGPRREPGAAPSRSADPVWKRAARRWCAACGPGSPLTTGRARPLGPGYLSMSPTTKNIEPRIATMSATRQPGEQLGQHRDVVERRGAQLQPPRGLLAAGDQVVAVDAERVLGPGVRRPLRRLEDLGQPDVDRARRQRAAAGRGRRRRGRGRPSPGRAAARTGRSSRPRRGSRPAAPRRASSSS